MQEYWDRWRLSNFDQEVRRSFLLAKFLDELLEDHPQYTQDLFEKSAHLYERLDHFFDFFKKKAII